MLLSRNSKHFNLSVLCVISVGHLVLYVISIYLNPEKSKNRKSYLKYSFQDLITERLYINSLMCFFPQLKSK